MVFRNIPNCSGNGNKNVKISWYICVWIKVQTTSSIIWRVFLLSNSSCCFELVQVVRSDWKYTLPQFFSSKNNSFTHILVLLEVGTEAKEKRKPTWLGTEYVAIDCLLVSFWTCIFSLFGMVSFRGVKISLYCFSSAFNIALSTSATAYTEPARPVNASEYIPKNYRELRIL